MSIKYSYVGVFISKSLIQKDLVAIRGTFSYDPDVQSIEMWAAVGVELRKARQARGWASTKELAEAKNRRPDQKTMDRIEKGVPGNVASIDAYCAALGVELANVLRAVIPGGEWSAQALELASAYDAMVENPKLQKILRELAEIWLVPQARQQITTATAAYADGSAPVSISVAATRGRKRRRT